MKLRTTDIPSGPIVAIRLRHDYEFEAGDYLGRAVAGDPIVRAIMPIPSHRTRQALATACRHLVQYAARWGEVYTTKGRLQGIAIWLPPAGQPAGLARSGSALLTALTADLEPNDTVRLVTDGMRLARFRRLAIERPHWHLVTLVAEPERSEEIADTLIRPILERTDREETPCFTATADPRQVLFFVQRGFKSVRDDLLTPLGPRVWSLVREPQP
jgi:hypothetical protein